MYCACVHVGYAPCSLEQCVLSTYPLAYVRTVEGKEREGEEETERDGGRGGGRGREQARWEQAHSEARTQIISSGSPCMHSFSRSNGLLPTHTIKLLKLLLIFFFFTLKALLITFFLHKQCPAGMWAMHHITQTDLPTQARTIYTCHWLFTLVTCGQ